MSKTSPLDAITQQLDDLSLDQLLEVRARVDTLINVEFVQFLELGATENGDSHGVIITNYELC